MSTAETQQNTGMSKAMMGTLLVWLAVIVYASSNSIVSLLADIGRQNTVMGRNAVSLCNLLFLGSLISLVPMVFMFYGDWTRENLRKLSRKDWGVLTLSAFLSSALTPALFFIALDYTSVTNVVLIGRIEPPLFLLATFFFLKEKLDPWAFAAGLIALVGAVVIIALKGDGAAFTLGKGEVATIFATLSFIASTLVTRVGLQGIPLGIFSIYRTVLGTIIYYFLALYLYGPNHFQDLFQPIVLKYVWVYAIIVIIIGQFAWNLGLKHARSGDVSLATSFSPLAALVIAMVLLGEDPGKGLIPGGLIILAAIAVGQFGRIRSQRTERRAAEAEEARKQATDVDMRTDEALAHESRINFKGA
ncbi:DMT family transporter [Roseovarius aestuarii]|uniref:EamA-like transporter family protein n=1 Tax=Roseovarius aestuarii TaxID=475083 RepID=A0A1X7BSN7_9RHOB|nr:DMT family transporter [Roseovarius aestuarii]SMC12584.1 EamA-like transporter family protein [Roseovarius aestuarii]